MINEIIDRAFREDIGEGDHSTLACVKEGATGSARLLVKEKGILAGVELAQFIFERFDPGLEMTIFKRDGSLVVPGDIAFEVKGSSRSILSTERIVLNFMQRMSGIATRTNHFVSLIEGTKAKLLDTRKTTPGIRYVEKWAVRIGGGHNHRFALYDMIMLKDNHIDFAGGITKAIEMSKQYLKDTGKDLKIMVEARNLTEVEEILQNDGIYRILLDNFDYEDTKKAVKMIGDTCLTESSGNINETTIRHYAECGVNYISSGALTHSVHNMDLSLKAIK